MTDRRKPETRLQAAIVSALEQLGFVAVRVQAGKHKVKGGWLQCAEPGTADLYVTRMGWRECKVPGKKPRANQLKWAAKMRAQGENVGTWWSVEEAVLEARSVLRAEAKRAS